MQKSLVPALFGRAEAREPSRAAAQDRRSGGDRLDIVHRRRAAVESHAGRKRRLHARHALLAFERLEHRCLFAADICACAVMDVEVERPAVDIVLADEFGLVGLVDRCLEVLAFEDVFAAQVYVSRMGAHAERGDQRALDQRMRIVAQDLAVLAGARLGFVGVDDKIVRSLGIDVLGHERPFQPGRKAGAAAAAHARGFHLGDDPIAPLVDDRLGVVPSAARPRALKAAVAEAVEVGENAILVFEHRLRFRLRAGMTGAAIPEACCLASRLRPGAPWREPVDRSQAGAARRSSGRSVHRRHKAWSATSARRPARTRPGRFATPS